MAENRLNIIAIDNKVPTSSKTIVDRKLEAKARLERLWLQDPRQFDPLRNCMEHERLERTMEIISHFLILSGKLAADLGCAAGVLARRIRDKGATLHAVDISSIALKYFRESPLDSIELFEEYVPHTSLRDSAYDLVVCTELIGYLHPNEYRMLFSELSRIVKPDGYIVCSTAVDINTDDAVQKFANLAETEFVIDQWIFSYHRLYIRIKDFFEAPMRFMKASRDHQFRLQSLEGRRSLDRWWFHFNSSKVMGIFWGGIQILFKPFVNILKSNRGLLLKLEKGCRFIWSDSGISHVILIGKRKPIIEKPPEDQIPRETKHKKMVWE